MGPLAPEIIGSSLNLIIALLIGIAFGYILEQAGFSSSRRLAGLFYGYDFVVLRVFFTAAITAMVGLVTFSFLGWINLELIYINPTFLASAIIGGIIMGAGFIVGGFCPGTSVCAAAIGKVDAMIFLAGIFTGIFIFGEAFPMFQGLYNASNLGDILVYESLGISRGLFALGLTIFAVIAFILTSKLEKKINGETAVDNPILRMRYSLTVGIAVIIGFALIFMPDKSSRALSSVENHWQQNGSQIEQIDIDALAMKMFDDMASLQIIDVRSASDFEQAHIPFAVNVPYEKLISAQWRKFLSSGEKTNIFYGADSETALKAALLSIELGDNRNAEILKGGFETFNTGLMTFTECCASPDLSSEVIKFRSNARLKLEELAAKASNQPAPVKEVRKVKGGC